MELIGKPPIHPFLFYSGKFSGYVIWIVAILSWFDIAIVHGMGDGSLRALALALWAVGLLLAAVSLVNLGASTRLGLPAAQTTFKTRGIYRFSRNPMYLGFDLLTLGAMARNPHVVIAAMGAYSMVMYHLIILGEEQFLRQRFGAAYVEYQGKVRRYF
jgi:protein-S-isoprenylcysteine O-methyltransferase Ste14